MYKAGVRNSQSGFTLIELTVVIALVGVVVLSMIPAVINFSDNDLSKSARQLVGTVKHLFNESALTKAEHRLVFEPKRGRYAPFKMEDRGGNLFERVKSGEWRQLPDNIRINRINISGIDKLLNGEVIAKIYPVGWVDEMLIELAADDRTLTIAINPLNGTAKIDEIED